MLSATTKITLNTENPLSFVQQQIMLKFSSANRFVLHSKKGTKQNKTLFYTILAVFVCNLERKKLIFFDEQYKC